ncbi:MAG: FadR family transcriptional regulator [Anaerolineaceae bacterium]|nr:FadR family transcriptional regulator [Anaerolineaceae bacterium]
MMLLQKIEQPKYEIIAQEIKDSIERGELTPGDLLLSERELSEKFNVSRTSARKALAVLAGMGLIEITPRHGAVVCGINPDQLATSFTRMIVKNRDYVGHLYEVRKIIEVQAAKLAASRCNNDDITQLWKVFQQSTADIKAGQDPHQADINLHAAIAQLTKNPFFNEVLTALVSSLMEVFAVIWKTPPGEQEENPIKLFVGQHQEIVEAIADRDPDRAGAVMEAHIDHSSRRLQKILREEAFRQSISGK